MDGGDDQKMILLKSSDGVTFQVKEAVAVELIKHVFYDINVDTCYPLHNVNSTILTKVIEYCERHALASTDEDLKSFDEEFVKVDQSTLFDLVLAANYLNIKSLLDLTCQTIADMVKGKTPDGIRRYFNLKNEFTPEEEEEVRRENSWAFE